MVEETNKMTFTVMKIEAWDCSPFDKKLKAKVSATCWDCRLEFITADKDSVSLGDKIKVSWEVADD